MLLLIDGIVNRTKQLNMLRRNEIIDSKREEKFHPYYKVALKWSIDYVLTAGEINTILFVMETK